MVAILEYTLDSTSFCILDGPVVQGIVKCKNPRNTSSMVLDTSDKFQSDLCTAGPPEL